MNWEVRTMRSVTSCFNSTLYRKNLSPLLAHLGPVLGDLAVCPAPQSAHHDPAGADWALEDLTHSLDYCSWVSVGLLPELWARCWPSSLACCAAMAVFSYLDASRSACMMHALPLRREALFFTNYLSGLSFLLLPNAGHLCASPWPARLWGTVWI